MLNATDQSLYGNARFGRLAMTREYHVKFIKLPPTPFTMIDLTTSFITSDTGTFTFVCTGTIQQANQARDGFICSNNPILLHSDAGLSS
jgi:hypothetical protein